MQVGLGSSFQICRNGGKLVQRRLKIFGDFGSDHIRIGEIG